MDIRVSHFANTIEVLARKLIGDEPFHQFSQRAGTQAAWPKMLELHNSCSQTALPPEIWEEVVQYLMLPDAVRISRTCRELYNIVRNVGISIYFPIDDNMLVSPNTNWRSLIGYDNFIILDGIVPSRTSIAKDVLAGGQLHVGKSGNYLSVLHDEQFIILDIYGKGDGKFYICHDCWYPSNKKFRRLCCVKCRRRGSHNTKIENGYPYTDEIDEFVDLFRMLLYDHSLFM